MILPSCHAALAVVAVQARCCLKKATSLSKASLGSSLGGSA